MTKVIYLHAKNYHPTHGAYAKAVNADFLQFDKYCRHDNVTVRFRLLRKYLSYLLLIIRFDYKKYGVILTDEPNIIPCIIKRLSLNRIKLVATQASNSPYYYFQNRISNYSKMLFRYAARQYDVIICIGDVQLREMKRIIGNDKNLYCTFNGVADDRYRRYSTFQYNPYSTVVFSLCNLFDRRIFENKGVDIMLKVMQKLQVNWSLKYDYVGRSSEAHRSEFLKKYQLQDMQGVFVGEQSDPSAWFAKSLMLLHLSRIDAFAVAVCESFAAGMPVFITDDIGSRMMFDTMANKDDYIIRPGQVDEAVEKITRFLELSPKEKLRESEKFREISKMFTEEKACNSYKKIFFGALNKS
ncbi:glycosyltransferase [Niabella hirudinis]|uniref:glycosyltransferase n=1 Tax=Niabella hirudinis TaxID=1285929 RepID=UPI003EB81AB0